MKLDLSGRKAVVTGAGHGIGLAVVQALVSAGAEVLGGARTISVELKEATDLTYEVDLSTPDGPQRMIGYALGEFGELDILVNNVGGGVMMAQSFLDIDDDVWQRTFELNLFSTIRACRAALPSLVRRRGSIVNIGSTNAKLADPQLAHYSAAKAAIVNLSKALSAEFSPLGVRINTISPGPTKTRIWTKPEVAEKVGMSPEQILASVPKMMGLSTGEMIDPTEIAALTLLLVSGTVPSITGTDYIIDAGLLKST